MYLIVNNYNKTYCLFGGFYEKNTKNLYNFILLTGCVDCLVSLNYSKIKKPTLYGELTIEPQILEKYNMSISQIEKQLLDHDFFKDWTIKKQTDSSLSIESPTSFIKEISTLTKQNNK